MPKTTKKATKNDQPKIVCICSVDFGNAFDRIPTTELIHTLNKLGIDGTDIQLLKPLY